jgi:hypothetical protein
MSKSNVSAAWFGAVLTLLAWSGCGGSTVIDGGSTAAGAAGSGAASTTGGSHQGGTATGTGTGTGGCGPNITCPAEPPTDGSSCICEAGLKCAYYLCDQSGDQLGATCDGTSWSVESEICTPLYCPNGIPCGGDSVCLVILTGFEAFFDCVPNPCPTQPLSCDCAAAICDAGYVCTSATAGQITCECTTC